MHKINFIMYTWFLASLFLSVTDYIVLILCVCIARPWKTRLSADTICRLYFNGLTSAQLKARYVELTINLADSVMLRKLVNKDVTALS